MSTTDEEWAAGPSLLASLWRYRYVVVVVTLATAALGYGLSQAQEPMYEAETRLFLADPRNQTAFGEAPRLDPARYVPQQAERMLSRPVLERASELLDGEVTAGEVGRMVEVEAAVELDTLTVTAADGSPQRAASTANAVAQAYEDVARQTTLADAEAAIAELESARVGLQEQIELAEAEAEAEATADLVTDARLQSLTQQLADLQSRAQQFAVNAAVFGSGVDLVEPAQAPDEPVSPSPRRDAALGGMLGMALAGAWAYWRAGRQDNVDSATAAADVLGVPLLGQIPHYRASKAGNGAVPAEVAEAYRFLFASIDYAMGEQGASSVMVTSPAQGDGKSTSALQTAIAAAGDGRRVVLVDGDVRARGLTHMIDAAHAPGLTEAVEFSLDGHEAVRPFHDADGVRLGILPAGAPAVDPTSFFRTPGFRRVMGEVRDHAELTILDSSPLLAVADATIAASHVEALVLVIPHNLPNSELDEIKQRLAFVATPVLGYIYNRSPFTSGHAYDYGEPRTEGRAPVRAFKALTGWLRDAEYEPGGNGGRTEKRQEWTSR